MSKTKWSGFKSITENEILKHEEKSKDVLCGSCYQVVNKELSTEFESHTGVTYRVCPKCWEREFVARRTK